MIKPKEFREQRVLRCDTRYEVQQGFAKGPFAGTGTLTIGRVVWVRDAPASTAGLASAFADGIGVVAIDPKSLA